MLLDRTHTLKVQQIQKEYQDFMERIRNKAQVLSAAIIYIVPVSAALFPFHVERAWNASATRHS